MMIQTVRLYVCVSVCLFVCRRRCMLGKTVGGAVKKLHNFPKVVGIQIHHNWVASQMP